MLSVWVKIVVWIYRSLSRGLSVVLSEGNLRHLEISIFFFFKPASRSVGAQKVEYCSNCDSEVGEEDKNILTNGSDEGTLPFPVEFNNVR